MNVNLCTDAPKHNLALMKISAYHKAQGDQVWLNGVGKFDLTYGSWLFDFSEKVPCDIEGGPGNGSLGRPMDRPIRGLHEISANGWPTGRLLDEQLPDYSLYSHITYSIGYTWKYCPRKCPFCLVPSISYSGKRKHTSIFSFHNMDFKEICLLNNNTFSDPDWKETFEEIWDAKLTVIDENGYDLRLMNEEKAEALKRTKFKGRIHYAWDLMENEKKIRKGLAIAPKGMVYVLVGFNTTEEEDLHRCQVIHDAGFDPYVMPYGHTKQGKRFKRFIDTRMYRKYNTIKEAWGNYR